jgi:hypothetical protein
VLKNTNKHFWRRCQGNNWRKDLGHQHTTSFSRITPCSIELWNKIGQQMPFQSFGKLPQEKKKNIEVPQGA